MTSYVFMLREFARTASLLTDLIKYAENVCRSSSYLLALFKYSLVSDRVVNPRDRRGISIFSLGSVGQ